jgi:hypothetical protein
MVNAADGTLRREEPLAGINNSEELEAWLRTQWHDVAVAFAARGLARLAGRAGRYEPRL